jgi:hypothetical protein
LRSLPPSFGVSPTSLLATPVGGVVRGTDHGHRRRVDSGVIQGDPVTLFGVMGVLLALVAIVMVSLAGDDDSIPELADADGPEPARAGLHR